MTSVAALQVLILETLPAPLSNSLIDEIKQLIGEERAECQKKIEELNSSLCEKIDQLMDHITSDCPPPEEEEITLCNITSSEWRRVAYINMTDPEAECPSGLNETSNSTTGQRACGRSVDGAGDTVAAPGGFSSVTFPVNTTYSNVCAYARGYQYYTMDAFWQSPIRTIINDAYIDGLSITHGNRRKHLWTLAVGNTELSSLHVRCTRDTDPFDFTRVPDFVGNNFYCEAGFHTNTGEARIAWEDPLWDEQQCTVQSTSCSRYGWFHRDIASSQEDIEVRWCADVPRGNKSNCPEKIWSRKFQ